MDDKEFYALLPDDDTTWHCIRSLATGQLLTFCRNGCGPVLTYRSREEAQSSLAALITSDPSGLWAVEPLPDDSFKEALGQPLVASHDRQLVAASFFLKSANGESHQLHIAGDPYASQPYVYEELLVSVQTFLSQISSSFTVVSQTHMALAAQESA